LLAQSIISTLDGMDSRDTTPSVHMPTYEAPTVSDLGSLAALTRGGSGGSGADYYSSSAPCPGDQPNSSIPS
jgi:hypothetical protein